MTYHLLAVKGYMPKPLPTPQERPDLYDYYDGLPDGEKAVLTTPPEIQKLIDERKKSKQDGGNQPAPKT